MKNKQETDRIKIVSKKFAENMISYEEMNNLLGHEEAKKVAFYTKLAKNSIIEGLK